MGKPDQKGSGGKGGGGGKGASSTNTKGGGEGKRDLKSAKKNDSSRSPAGRMSSPDPQGTEARRFRNNNYARLFQVDIVVGLFNSHP